MLPSSLRINPELLHRVEIATPAVDAHSPFVDTRDHPKLEQLRLDPIVRSRITSVGEPPKDATATSPTASSVPASPGFLSSVRLAPSLRERVQSMAPGETFDAAIDEIPEKRSSLAKVRLGPGVLERVESVKGAPGRSMAPVPKPARATSSLVKRCNELPEEVSSLTPETKHLVTPSLIDSLNLGPDVRRRISSAN